MHDLLTMSLPAVSLVGGGPSFNISRKQAKSPVRVSRAQQWLMLLLRNMPQPSGYRSTADYVSAVTDYCLATWLTSSADKLPSIDSAILRFRQTMTEAGDLSARQIDQLCQRTFSVETDLPTWLCGTTERYVSIIKPWIPVWINFTKWALQWCRHNSIDTLAFLARDALPFFVAATVLDQRPRMYLTHISRAQGDSLAADSILRQPSVALIDSGCYGTCINSLQRRRDTLVNGTGHKRLATLLYYSRNPQLFGYMNYVMSRDILANPKTMNYAAEFIVYAGDLLEALPKAYQYQATNRTMVEASDILSFTVSLAVLSEISGMAEASMLLDIEQPSDIYDQVRPLYCNYQLSRYRSGLCSGFPFDEPTPKALPSSSALAGLNFLEIPPQSHIFGTVSG